MLTRQSPAPSEFFSTATDSLGAFAFDGLVAGRYTLGVASPMLDSLGVLFPASNITVAQGERRAVHLGIPSGATIRARLCPGVVLRRGQGALLGRVLDARTEEGLAEASLELHWAEILFDTVALRGHSAVRMQRIGVSPAGEFVACGLPSDSWIDVRVLRAGREGSVIRTTIPDDVGIARIDLSFDASASLDTLAAATLPDAIAESSGNASLTGVVRGDHGELVRDAELHVRSTSVTVRADKQGRFVMHGLPAGTQVVEARHLGYRSAEAAVELRAGRLIRRDIVLGRAVVLDSVLVLAHRARYAEFYEDQKHLFGRYYEGATLAHDAAFMTQTSDLVASTGGYRAIGFGYQARLQKISHRNPCAVRPPRPRFGTRDDVPRQPACRPEGHA